MMKRLDQVDNEHAFALVAESLKDRIGGVWKDPRANRQYVIMALPTLSQGDKSRLIESLPTGATYRFEPATISQATLYKWVDALTKSLMTRTTTNSLTTLFDALHLAVSTIMPDVHNGRLAIWLTSLPSDIHAFYTEWDQAAILGLAPSRSFTDFEVGGTRQPAECSTDSPGQIKSGLLFHGFGRGGCSSNLAGYNAAGNISVLTAGH